MSVHSRAKNFFGSISSHFNKPEICLGSHEFDITISPSEKKIERITLQNSETDDQYQILVVYGTFVSTNVMTLLQNKLIYEGYITVYTKGRYTPVKIHTEQNLFFFFFFYKAHSFLHL